ncbi:MAG: 16S rRNA (cytidine(1402)-2'-O)-methyltransferase [bacterium]
MTALPEAGVLYVVATPIGHLGDLTRRAEKVLKSVQIVAAEDTRRTRGLLDHIDHHTPELLSLHEHNEQQLVPKLLARLQAGADIAIVSDAGTPLVNDPGYLLVGAAYEAGIRIVPVPGACAITTALSVCPLPCQPFLYVGFLPAKSSNRQRVLQELLAQSHALVFLEAPHRILASLQDISALCDRRVMIGRELTKQYETILAGKPDDIIQSLGEHPKGEFTCVIEAAAGVSQNHDQVKVLTALLAELPAAKAAKVAAAICGVRKSEMYDLALTLAARIPGRDG